MSILKKKYPEELLGEYIKHFDELVFGNNKLEVIIKKGATFSPAASFLQQPTVLKILSLGILRDQYLIFSESGELVDDEESRAVAATRVVRKRYQANHKSGWLSPVFVRRKKILPKELIQQFWKEICFRYRPGCRIEEFDNVVIQYCIRTNIQNKKLTQELQKELLTSNRYKIEKTLWKLV